MKSCLKFYDFETNDLSDCSQVLDIEVSSSSVNWSERNIIVEKGSSPYFYPKNVYTPYFYFALALEQDLSWQAETHCGMTELKTNPGDIWINPPNTPFSHQISEPCFFIILAVEEKRFLNSFSPGIGEIKLQFLNNYNVHDKVIEGIIDLFLIEVKAKGRNGHAYLQNLLSLLATYYIQNYSNYVSVNNGRVDKSTFDQKQLDKIDDFISDNISTPISVDDLANLLDCSKFHFLREFKKVTGITPYQHLINKRLKRAKLLLSTPKNSIASVSFELGFNDQAHFTRTFKKKFGITPGQFQNK